MSTLAFASSVVPRASRVDASSSRVTRQVVASHKSRARHVPQRRRRHPPPPRASQGSNDDTSGWWEKLPMISRILPPSAREAAREIEYFGGSPLQQVLPWVPKPRADSPGRPFVNDPENQLVLFDFTSTSPDSNPETFGKTFGALNDVVMGGQSEASVSLVKVPKQDGGCVAKLSGVVEGDNGGFASMRSRDFQPSVDLGDYYGLRLTVKGDGRRYKLIARDVVDFFGLAWHCGFDTTEGEWLEIDVPFTELTPVLRADVLRPDSSEWRTFRRDQLRSLQIMLSKYELGMKELNTTFASGPFSLELKSIRAYKEERDPIVKKGREIVKSLKSGDSDNNAR